MNTGLKEAESEVLEGEKPRGDKDMLQSRWGKEVIEEGFAALPSILMKSQKRLGLTNNHLVVLLHLVDHWFGVKSNIHPSIRTLAERMDLSDSRTRTLISELEKGGFLRREPRMTTGGQSSNQYFLDGLVKKVQKLQPEFAAQRKKAADEKKGLEKPKNPTVKKI